MKAFVTVFDRQNRRCGLNLAPARRARSISRFSCLSTYFATRVQCWACGSEEERLRKRVCCQEQHPGRSTDADDSCTDTFTDRAVGRIVGNV
jgi:hypothetical protein